MKDFDKIAAPGSIEIALDGACAYTFDGYDTDGTEWYLCETHGITAPSPDAACAGNNNSPALVRD